MDALPSAEAPPRPVVRLPVRRGPVTMRIALPTLRRFAGPDAFALSALAIFLTGFGLLMVLSASSVEASAAGNPYSTFATQGVAALLGTGAMLVVATRLRPAALLRIGPIAFVASVVLQVLTATTPLGTVRGGNSNWIQFAGLSLQPSEFVKLSLVLVLAGFFQRRAGERLTVVGLVPPVLLSCVAIGAVYLGHDLGTSMVLSLIVVGGFLFGGVRLPVLGLLGASAGGVLLFLSQADTSRIGRLGAWQQGCTDILSKYCWQTTQAEWALANGGLTGVGIGNSVSKWFWLPEAANDFIAAVIGEETGLLGLTVVIGCFVAIAVVCLRIAARARDRFTRAAAGMALAWIVGQAFANLAVVVGVAPVFGVPLPFVSAGGTSLVSTLLLVGCVMAAADRPLAPPPAHPDHPAGRGVRA